MLIYYDSSWEAELHVKSAILIAIGVFFFSLTVFPYAISGDQIHYRIFYDASGRLPYSQLMDYQRWRLGSGEPVYGHLCFIFSRFFPKDIFISFLNGALAYHATLFLLKKNIHFFVILIIIFLQYYSYVLFFYAERLKIAILFLLWALNSRGGFRYILFMLSALSHAQVIIFQAALLSSWLIRKGRDIRREVPLNRFKFPSIIFFSILFTLAIYTIYLLFPHIIEKLRYAPKVESLYSPLIFMFASLILSKDRALVGFAFFPILLTSFLLGDGRINIIAYYLFVFFSAEFRRGFDPISIIFLTYFALGGVDFLDKVLRTGHGFY